jgi:hypothetical protein
MWPNRHCKIRRGRHSQVRQGRHCHVWQGRHTRVFIISTRGLTVLLELCCLEEEEEVFDPPTRRVQAPLYRQGPSYRVLSDCPAAGFSVAAALARVPFPHAPLPGCRLLYKAPLFPGPAYSGYMPPARLGSFRGDGVCLVRLVEAVRGWRHSGLQPIYVAPVGPLQPLIKRWLKVSSSSPAWTLGGEDLSRLLAQPALRSKPASSARCRGNPWDVSRQVALPSAYPDSHPHDRAAAGKAWSGSPSGR